MSHRQNRLSIPNLWVFLVLFSTLGCSDGHEVILELGWGSVPDRPWPGPELWANRVQDWEVREEKLWVVGTLPLRTAHLLTHRIEPEVGEVRLTVEMGLSLSEFDSGGGGGDADENTGGPDFDAVGVIMGAGGPDLDPRRAALIHHSPGPGAGLFLGVDTDGHLVAFDFSQESGPLSRSSGGLGPAGMYRLEVLARPEDPGVRLTLFGEAVGSDGLSESLDLGVLAFGPLTGGVALAAHTARGKNMDPWFEGVLLSGEGVTEVEDGFLGPILGAQHTLHRGTLRLTAQLLPVSGPLDGSSPAEADSVLLEFRADGGGWTEGPTVPVVVPGYTATFQLRDWDPNRTVEYRVTFLPGPGRGPSGASYFGTVRAEPTEKEELVVAAFTGNHNVASPGVDRGSFDWKNHLWFPHEELVAHVEAHAPDFLFFSGDQVYEGASPTAADLENPYGDYLYKWYLWLWAFRDLTRDIPSVAIPDDHDVFHGNVWGAGGRATPQGLSGAAAQDQGGYKLPPGWVNMVQRTHASHLPQRREASPSDDGIETYFTDVSYGGVSFAVVEDRKFKSPPKLLLPEADVWNGWAQNPDFDAKIQADVPGASLLGEDQERFLEEWAGDWGDGIWMKVLLSQTIFANVATIPQDAKSGSVIPSLPIPQPGVWVEGDKQAADMDSNGWPQAGRNRALRAIRKGFAVHLAGDQHLASTIQYGVDEWHDGPFALCVPSIANFWPRRWYPPVSIHAGETDLPPYAGDFEDGFGNLMTVHAVSNPAQWGREPEILHNRAPGYGIARFNRSTREVSLEAWPRWADPLRGDEPYPGWPVRFSQRDGYGREAFGFLPTLLVEGLDDPVVQVSSETGGEVIYTLRISGRRFTPEVFEAGSYTVQLGEPGTPNWRAFLGQTPTSDSTRTLEVVF